MGELTLQAARPWPLGATWDGKGINFALFSKHASAITICLFDSSHRLIERVALKQRQDSVWFVYLTSDHHAIVAPGLLYGYQVDGPWLPEKGHQFDVNQVLLDPYARQIEHDPLSITAPFKACVVVDHFDWGTDRRPYIAPVDTVLYELHVKGFTQSNEGIPLSLRGTYLGLAHSASIAHLKALGVSSLSLLPVHYWLDEPRLTALGLSNYWGYNSIGFFAPSPRFASTQSQHSVRDQFRQMVKTLHANGIEVLLDVVYNHTAESDAQGPTISFRGIDNTSYYRLTEAGWDTTKQQHTDAISIYENYSGCGNVLDIRQPVVLKLVMDSLRFWVSDMHVDGFRFDLAPVLGRDTNGFNAANAFFMAIAQDPILATVKLIAEPWDIGPDGYQLGNFPSGWLEWNDTFRDTVRGYWLGHQIGLNNPPNIETNIDANNHACVSRGEFAKRLCASADIFERSGRSPLASVNFIAAHDGFTLRDLVSYSQRNNFANGENNRDGHGHNLSNNCGCEGPSTDAAINKKRGLMQRALIATTLLAQGTPMLCAGDEIGKTQRGNNNAYCQDNPISWLDWPSADPSLQQFIATVLSIRKNLGGLANSQWFDQTLQWFEPSGDEISSDAWDRLEQPAFYCTIRDTLVIGFNPTSQDIKFVGPAGYWQVVLDSSDQTNSIHPGEVDGTTSDEQTRFVVSAHSLLVLKKTV